MAVLIRTDTAVAHAHAGVMKLLRHSGMPIAAGATDAQATDMESEGQGQQNPTLPLPSPARPSWRGKRPTVSQTSTVPASRRDTHRTNAQTPRGAGTDAQLPSSMPRAEDDVISRANSHEFHDRPGSGWDTARRRLFF
jgi:hypothetical protein